MDVMHLSERACRLLSVLDESDALFMKNWDRPRSIRHKGERDLVTDTDVAIEAFLKEQLQSVVPGASFLAEESAVSLYPEDLLDHRSGRRYDELCASFW